MAEMKHEMEAGFRLGLCGENSQCHGSRLLVI